MADSPSPQVYELASPGAPLVTVKGAKEHLRVEHDAEDSLLALLVRAATDAAEKYCGRELRANQWLLFQDSFCPRIRLLRDPVAAVNEVARLVSGTFSAVAAPTYYLRSSAHFSEVLLAPDEEWPDDLDEVELAVRVSFTTKAHRCADQARLAILRLVAWLHENRGDCDPSSGTEMGHAIRQSGAAALLDQIRIPRF